MNQLDYFKGLNIAITISAKDGEILYQNDSSIEVNGDARGRDLMKCHNERSQQIIRHLLDDAATNVYTISKKGKKKLIYQTPWYEDDAKQIVGGLIEFSIILPEDMPHYDRGWCSVIVGQISVFAVVIEGGQAATINATAEDIVRCLRRMKSQRIGKTISPW